MMMRLLVRRGSAHPRFVLLYNEGEHREGQRMSWKGGTRGEEIAHLLKEGERVDGGGNVVGDE